MSKLTNLIEVHQTGRVRLVPHSPVVQVKEESTSVIEPLKVGMLEYRLEVKFAVRGYADKDKSEDIVRLKDMAKRQILEEVFGEFRPMLRRVERAIYELNWDEARDALRDLEMEMRY